MRPSATEAVACPACRSGAKTQTETYVFARPYLCAWHCLVWDRADEAAHRSAKVCPHFPAACSRCGSPLI